MSKLTEQMNFEGAKFIEDNGNRVIQNVVFLGAESAHGYTYKQEAMAKGVGLYNGVQCFINHPTAEEEKSGRRDTMKIAGVTQNARHEEGKIKGDVKLLDDAQGRKFWNIAHTMPTVASCSHIADGNMVEEGGKQFVDEITEVISVDLVVNGATTSTVFESIEKKGDDMDYSKITIEELKRLRPDICKGVMEEGMGVGKKSRDDEFKKLTESNDALKKQVDEQAVKESAAKKTASVEKLLSESKLPKSAKTDVFRDQLMALDEDNFDKSAKALIEDRQALAGGVKNMGSREDNNGDGDSGSGIAEDIVQAEAEMAFVE